MSLKIAYNHHHNLYHKHTYYLQKFPSLLFIDYFYECDKLRQYKIDPPSKFLSIQYSIVTIGTTLLRSLGVFPLAKLKTCAH